MKQQPLHYFYIIKNKHSETYSFYAMHDTEALTRERLDEVIEKDTKDTDSINIPIYEPIILHNEEISSEVFTCDVIERCELLGEDMFFDFFADIITYQYGEINMNHPINDWKKDTRKNILLFERDFFSSSNSEERNAIRCAHTHLTNLLSTYDTVITICGKPNGEIYINNIIKQGIDHYEIHK